ncbi:portal protein [Pleomorphomonas koreensis]|uniref:portal protein n=1 Tax=Pleomorphomonas koreensis TaxID=257440 RepID=UPI0003FE88E5|nr:portal protein [Pleomorphomonas koreensis]
MSEADVLAQKKKADKVWSDRAPWDSLYREAYEYAIPQRRPSGQNQTKRLADKIFDMTACMSSMYFAGSLQRDLFPAGKASIILESGPVARSAFSAGGVAVLDRHLGAIANRIQPFFLTGDWDTAVHEACIDLGVGSGAVIPVKGTRDNPLSFVTPPFDDLAMRCDMFGRVNFVSWLQSLLPDEIMEGFPDGRFDKEFRDKAVNRASTPIRLYQDFFVLPGGRRWRMVAYTEGAKDFHVVQESRTKPLATPRYYRVPGEAYGRGPLLLALPSIKTLNKAQELALKSAAIQMLGIWGYRAGGTFNPDTASVQPGAFWAMQSTGGMLGPDVQRIDPANGRLEVAKMVIGDLQQQIKQALYDMRLPEEQGTPRSASEIAARLQQKAETHIGAFGRLTREIMPVIVPRAAEILYDFGILSSPLNVDEFLISCSVRSPMQAAMNADDMQSIASYLEFAQAIVGQPNVKYYADLDKVMELVRKGFQIPQSVVPDEQKVAAMRQQDAAQQAIAAAMQAGGIDPTKVTQQAA